MTAYEMLKQDLPADLGNEWSLVPARAELIEVGGTEAHSWFPNEEGKVSLALCHRRSPWVQVQGATLGDAALRLCAEMVTKAGQISPSFKFPFAKVFQVGRHALLEALDLWEEKR